MNTIRDDTATHTVYLEDEDGNELAFEVKYDWDPGEPPEASTWDSPGHGGQDPRYIPMAVDGMPIDETWHELDDYINYGALVDALLNDDPQNLRGCR
jgi:hypothetical protein